MPRNRIREDVVYKFEELSEDAKDKAIELLYDLNIDHEWWESVYDDAENIGLKLTSFDLDHHNIDGKFTLSAHEVAQNILNNHGEKCETYKTAESFMEKHNPVFADYMDEESPKYESRESEEELLEMESEFLQSLLEDYRIILQHEYEYLTSKEAIIESIKANEYEFTKEGELI